MFHFEVFTMVVGGSAKPCFVLLIVDRENMKYYNKWPA